ARRWLRAHLRRGRSARGRRGCWRGWCRRWRGGCGAWRLRRAGGLGRPAGGPCKLMHAPLSVDVCHVDLYPLARLGERRPVDATDLEVLALVAGHVEAYDEHAAAVADDAGRDAGAVSPHLLPLLRLRGRARPGRWGYGGRGG